MKTMYYIGLDVHKRTISYCVKDGSGTIHAEGTIAPRALTWIVGRKHCRNLSSRQLTGTETKSKVWKGVPVVSVESGHAESTNTGATPRVQSAFRRRERKCFYWSARSAREKK